MPGPFSVEALCERLGEQRRRPIHLHALPLRHTRAGTCGLWLSTAIDDHIFFEQQTTRVHQEHIVLHEVGHMLFDHHTVDEEDGWITALLTDLDPRAVRRMLARSNYSTRQEREAEMMASLIRTGLSLVSGPCTATAGGPRQAGVLARLRDGLGLGGCDEV
ncbi:hypothetical protein [Streptomyces lavendulocolor]|uniref:hypothetical protein n=1 Tax=Streptomyces lavendulocolor TaxID=67316 RepID=UPI003C2DF698